MLSSRFAVAAALVAVAFGLGPTGARAQFGSIFGAPPRPPAAVPGGRQPVPPPDQDAYPPEQYPPEQYPPQQYPPQQQYPQQYPPPSGGRVASPGAVQSQPLPPPPGVASPDANPPGQPALSSLPQGQRPPPRGAPQPVDTSPQPGDQVVAEPPSQKIANNAALFSGLDKITGRIINFDVAIGETVQFGALQVTPRACYTRPPTETANTDAFVEVDEVTLQGEVQRIFTGWMFAASPGLHGVEHAIYDVWLTDCKSPVQTVNATPDPPPAAPPPPRAQQNQQRAQQQQPATARRPTPPRN